MKKDNVQICNYFLSIVIMTRWDMVPHTKSQLKRMYKQSVVPHPTPRHVVLIWRIHRLENCRCG